MHTATAPLEKYGLAPAAGEAFALAGLTVGRLTQTLGHAPASAGYHALDGIVHGMPYCAATDISVRDMDQSEIRDLLGRLADHGVAAFYRRPGYDHWPSRDPEHIHAIYAGLPMKSALQDQVHEWLHGRNGLVGKQQYEFWQPNADQRNLVRSLFLDHNPPEVR